MMINIRKRALSLIMTLVISLLAVAVVGPVNKVEAASTYIKVDEFIKYLVTQMGLPVESNSKTPYIDAAKKAGILKDGDFKSYSGYLYRGDCAVLVNRADKYLNGAYYGYSKEVYEFLKDCTYVNGYLFYNIKGKLFPKDATDSTYSATEFYEEKIKPILESSFQFSSDIGPGYRYMEYNGKEEVYLQLGKLVNTFSSPFEEDEDIVQAWKSIVDWERKVKAVYDERIGDLNKVSKSKRQDIAETFAKGIFKGSSNGKYVQNRTFNGKSKIKAADAKTVVGLLLDPSKRAKVSPDGQLIRTKNLPKNYKEFPYILECFPNEFYEMKFRFQGYENWKSVIGNNYKLPVDIGNDGILYRYQNFIYPYMKPYEYYDTIMSKTQKFVTNIFNVDYRTVNKNWIENVASCYMTFGGENIYDLLAEYVDTMKKNQVVIESKHIAVEPSTLYFGEGDYFVRVYVKYRITAKRIDVEYDNELIFGQETFTTLVGLKNGEWRYGYYDIRVDATNMKDARYMEFGIDPWAGISDALLRGPKRSANK